MKLLWSKLPKGKVTGFLFPYLYLEIVPPSPSWMVARMWDSTLFFYLHAPFYLDTDRASRVHQNSFSQGLVCLLFVLRFGKMEIVQLEKTFKCVKWEISYSSSLKSPPTISSNWA